MDNGQYEQLVEGLRTSAGLQDVTRLTQGEIAFVIAQDYGTLKQAAIDAHIEYKTLAEYKRVIAFYGANSAGQKLEIGESYARTLLNEHDVLRWTHLRVAVGLRDFEEAIDALLQAVDEGMTPLQFKRHVARLRKQNGHPVSKIVIDARAGYKVTITR